MVPTLSLGATYAIILAAASVFLYLASGGLGSMVVPCARPTGRLRVLAADDDDFDLEMMRRLIGRVLPNADAVYAAGWEEALQLTADDAYFDIALLDLNMPGCDGAELAAELRSRHAARLIVAVTGVTPREGQVEGFDQVVEKGGLELALGRLKLAV